MMSRKWRSKSENVTHDNVYDGIYIPLNYRDGVIKHILLNYASKTNGYQSPLFLAIQGVRGEGKTFMLRKICEFYGINYKFISGSKLCGQNEGDSVKSIKKEYESACIETYSSKQMHLLIIDDFHLSIAANFDKNVSRTTNAQVLVSYLMNLADDPYINGIRVPVILVGNDFTNIYSALIRNGRTNFLKWVPNIEDKINIVYYMYKEFYPSINRSDVASLVQKFADKYIAFFQGVLQELFFSGFNDVINEFHCRKGHISILEISNLIDKKLNAIESVDYQLLSKYADMQLANKEEKFD